MLPISLCCLANIFSFLLQLASPERSNSPQVNLASNNPFRNRALSPASNLAASRPERPTSTNPFLDDTDAISPQSAPGATMVSPIQPLQPVQPVQRVPQDVIGNTSELFVCITPFFTGKWNQWSNPEFRITCQLNRPCSPMVTDRPLLVQMTRSNTGPRPVAIRKNAPSAAKKIRWTYLPILPACPSPLPRTLVGNVSAGLVGTRNPRSWSVQR